MNLSVVIPAYNEEENIKEAVFDVANHFPDAEIIVVNDKSTDNTRSILEGLKIPNLKVLNNFLNSGHGYTVMRGLAEARGDYILYVDADRQIALNNLDILKGMDVASYDFVSGWRTGRYDKPFRKFISFCLKTTNLLFHHYYIKDANCPFKLYKREALLPLLDKVPNTNIVPIACLDVLARKAGLKTITIQTPHKPYQGIRAGKLQSLNPVSLKFFWDAFWEVVKL